MDQVRRGLPCNIQPDARLWCVVGHERDGNGGGILEWCYDRADAIGLAKRMRAAGYRDAWAKKYTEVA